MLSRAIPKADAGAAPREGEYGPSAKGPNGWGSESWASGPVRRRDANKFFRNTWYTAAGAESLCTSPSQVASMSRAVFTRVSADSGRAASLAREMKVGATRERVSAV